MIQRSRMGAAVALAMGLLGTSSTPAAVVDFEDLAVAPGSILLGADLVSGGMGLDSAVNHTHLAQAVIVGNGGTFLVLDDTSSDNVLTVAPAVAAPFNLHALDVAEFGYGLSSVADDRPATLNLTGHLWGGGMLTAAFTLDGVWDGPAGGNDFETFTLTGWNNLASVDLQGTGSTSGGDYWALDNLVYTPVPEPGSLALLGLAGRRVRRRRRGA